jgi:hypothetical protein
MDEQTIKVLARFVEVGQWWPVGAWINWNNGEGGWLQIMECEDENHRKRWTGELSELECNVKGIFRKEEEDENR